MYGYWFSVREHFNFSRSEISQLFWTSLAFGFALSFRKWGSGESVDFTVGILNLFFATIAVLLSLYIHVSLQKLVAIKLGYKATYSYWLNGVLFTIFLAFLSFGYVAFLLPGSVMIEHIPKLRLGKFRYGINLKDIARVALAGPLSHILIVLIVGPIFFMTGREENLLSLIIINLLLAIYSTLPIPKIDTPSKMEGGSDGLGLFYYSRTLFVLVFVTVVVFAALVFSSATLIGIGWLFLISFIIGCIISLLYSIWIEQKN
ncbi:MAG: hypothetical protein KatS3mg002_0604 [Candidatus Woesearchaeota archaeon]|nr:MAG: hypothetical protein KatS3mg002_0604 [Candidatus Woesearchaeota archaeon]